MSAPSDRGREVGLYILLMPLPVSQFCNLEGWNTFHISFDLTGQENRWETGMLVELVFATVTTRVTRHGEFPKYSVC